MPEERIQKVLAAAGVASRRAAETLVGAGRVRVDGKVATIGQKVDPARSTIEVDGDPVGIGVARAYVALHKPAGVTSTTRDRHAATTVLDLVPTALVPDGTRLYPVGRLDQDSEGLLLLTNDGDWAERVLHPRFGVEREYAVAVAAPLTGDQARALNAGIQLDEGLGKLLGPIRTQPGAETRDLAATLDPPPDPSLSWYRVNLAQGWKRQLRRMFGSINVPIIRLVRVRIGAVRLDDLQSGAARILKAPEIKGLGAGRNTESTRSRPAPGAGRPRKGPSAARSRSSTAGRTGCQQQAPGTRAATRRPAGSDGRDEEPKRRRAPGGRRSSPGQTGS